MVVLVVVCVVVAVDRVVNCVGGENATVLSTSVRFSSSDTSIGEVDVLWKDFSTNSLQCTL